MKAIVSQEQIRHRNKRRVIAACVIALVFLAFLVTSQFAKHALRYQSAESLKTSIVNCANQCYAIEGAYPPSIRYLEEKYGLLIDHNDFFVTYDSYAENIAPKVTVTPR